jgi:hypothetical protein
MVTRQKTTRQKKEMDKKTKARRQQDKDRVYLVLSKSRMLAGNLNEKKQSFQKCRKFLKKTLFSIQKCRKFSSPTRERQQTTHISLKTRQMRKGYGLRVKGKGLGLG